MNACERFGLVFLAIGAVATVVGVAMAPTSTVAAVLALRIAVSLAIANLLTGVGLLWWSRRAAGTGACRTRRGTPVTPGARRALHLISKEGR